MRLPGNGADAWPFAWGKGLRFPVTGKIPRFAGRGIFAMGLFGSGDHTRQISLAYWRMVRSEENLPAEATLIRHLRAKPSGSAA